MAKATILGESELAFLRALIAQDVAFMIVGNSAAVLQGAPVVTQDVDLWFDNLSDDGIRKAVKKVDGIFVPSFGHNPPMFAGESIKLFDIVFNPQGLESYDKEKRHNLAVKLADIYVPVLALSRVIKSKERANRPKDQAVLPVLKDVLKTLELAKRPLHWSELEKK